MGVALDEPSSIENLDALRAHRLNRGREMLVCRLLCLDLHGGCLVRQRADQTVSVPKLRYSDGDLCLDDGVDTADLVCNLPGAFEEDGIADIAFDFRHWEERKWEIINFRKTAHSRIYGRPVHGGDVRNSHPRPANRRGPANHTGANEA